MAHEAKIEFKDHGFWIPEAFIEILSEYICETFENIGVDTFSQNLQEIYGDCDSNRGGARYGMVNILFDESITNNSDKEALITLLDQTKSLLQSKGDELSIETLNQIESRKVADYFKSPWHFPIKTQSLVATINIIQQMLNGTWLSNSYGVYYVGFPNGGNWEEI